MINWFTSDKDRYILKKLDPDHVPDRFNMKNGNIHASWSAPGEAEIVHGTSAILELGGESSGAE